VFGVSMLVFGVCRFAVARFGFGVARFGVGVAKVAIRFTFGRGTGSRRMVISTTWTSVISDSSVMS